MKKLIFIILMVIQTATLLFTACGRMGPVPPPDPTPPTVNATTPADGTTDFPVTGTIAITFSKDMDPTSVDDSTVPVASDAGQPVSGSYTTTGAVTVFTPSQNLNEHTRFKVTVSTGVKDSYGIAATSPTVFYFTTQSFPPPRVVDVQPASRLKNVSPQTTLSIMFSEPMDPTTINEQTVSVINSNGNLVSGSAYYNQTISAAVFVPDIPFTPTTNYILTVTTGVTDMGQTHLTDAFVSSFQTGTVYDATVPTVVSPTVPNNSATNVSANTPITAMFSESMDLLTITPSEFIVSHGTTSIPGDIKCYGNTVVFTPTTPLAHSTPYAVTIKGYSLADPGVMDAAGNSMVADYTWQFTTGPLSTDTVRPSVLATWPTPTQNNVSIYKEVVALFSESMLASSVTPTTFVLFAQNDPNKVPIPGQVKTNGAAVIFIPSQNWAYNTTYTAAIVSASTPTTTLGVTDLAGNPINGNSSAGYTWNFTTEATASFTITANAGPRGGISPAGATLVNYGGSQTYTITPNAGYSIDDVLVDGSSVGPVASYTFTSVDSDHTITASFLMTVTATAGANGSISPSGAVLVSYNTTPAFTISPNANYHINAVGGTCGGTLVGNVFTTSPVTQSCTVQPSFAANPVITASAGTGGTITPVGAVSVIYGGAQSFTFTPAAGYYLTGVTVDGVAQTPVPASYTFTNVIANHTISATFGTNPVITASAGTNGTITPTGSVSVAYGANQTFTFTPAAGYYVSAVTVDGVNVGLPNSYTFYNVTANHTIAVAFAQGSYTITATAGAGGTLQSGGTIVSSGSSQDFLVSYNGSRAFTITPNAGYRIASVLVDSVSQGAIASYTFNNVIANHTISATFALNPVITASVGTGGTISPSGSVSVTYGASQTFNISPNAGYSITSVLVDGVAQTPVPASYTFTNVIANHTISATFTLGANTITASAGTGGSISPTGAVAVTYGANQTFTITPTAGYSIASVLVDGVSQGAVASYTFTNVIANHTISATFAINPTITASAGANGTISPTGAVVVTYNTNQTFTFAPAAGYYISAVTVDGVNVGSPNSYTFYSVTANHTIAVAFAQGSNTITATAGAGGTLQSGGTIVSSGSSQDFLVSYGGSRSFTITPNTGYHILDVQVDSVSQGAVASYTFTNVIANHTISATFALNPVITASAGTGGTITPSGSVSVTYGASQTFTISPNAGYSVTGVSVDGVAQTPVPASYTFTNIIANHTISATFAINTFTVTPSAGANGTISPNTVQTVNYNATTSFTVTPSAGYTATVGGTCGGSLVGTTYTTNPITANCTVVASFSINAFTINASAGANGSISPTGVVGVTYGGSQTFTITPAANYHVLDVQVDGGSVGAVASYSFTNVQANHTIAASFAINTFTVTPSVSGGSGTISPNTVQTVNYNATTSFTVTPSAGYTATVGGTCGGSLNGTLYTTNPITANCTVIASFSINAFTINASAGANGSISPSGAVGVNYGGSQTFTITPAANYHVLDVQVDGSSVGAVTSYPFTNVQANHIISATFAINTFTVTPSAGTNGTISPSSPQTVNYGATTYFSLSPAAGYHAVVGGTCGGSLDVNGTTYTTNAVTANCSVQASFVLNTYTITASAGSNGSISPSGTVTVNYGGNQSFTITANVGFLIADISVDGFSLGPVASPYTYPFTNVSSNHTIIATFQ